MIKTIAYFWLAIMFGGLVSMLAGIDQASGVAVVTGALVATFVLGKHHGMNSKKHLQSEGALRGER